MPLFGMRASMPMLIHLRRGSKLRVLRADVGRPLLFGRLILVGPLLEGELHQPEPHRQRCSMRLRPRFTREQALLGPPAPTSPLRLAKWILANSASAVFFSSRLAESNTANFASFDLNLIKATSIKQNFRIAIMHAK